MRNCRSQDEFFTPLGDLPAGTEVQLCLTPGDRRHVGQSRLVSGGRTFGLLCGGGGSVQIQHFIHLQYRSV